MNRNVIIVIVLVVLVLFTAVQAIQLSSLRTTISTGKVNIGGTPTAQAGNSVASSINDLPSMVGGC